MRFFLFIRELITVIFYIYILQTNFSLTLFVNEYIMNLGFSQRRPITEELIVSIPKFAY